jgi:hypothetical protein
MLFVQQSVSIQIRVATGGQGPLVTVDKTVMVRPVPQQELRTTGGSKAQEEPHATVLLVAQATIGGVMGITVTVWVQEAVKPEQLVTIHLNWMTCGQTPLVTLQWVRILLGPQQGSGSMGGSFVQGLPHGTVLSAAQMMVGGGH